MDQDSLQDLLEIHFQKTSNGGGEVDAIIYNPVGQQTLALFDEDTSAEDQSLWVSTLNTLSALILCSTKNCTLERMDYQARASLEETWNYLIIMYDNAGLYLRYALFVSLEEVFFSPFLHSFSSSDNDFHIQM